jgi:hypothetical protein
MGEKVGRQSAFAFNRGTGTPFVKPKPNMSDKVHCIALCCTYLRMGLVHHEAMTLVATDREWAWMVYKVELTITGQLV